jgi:hypothetical protein
VGAAVVGLAVGVEVGRRVGETDGDAVVGDNEGVTVGFRVTGLAVVGRIVVGEDVIVGCTLVAEVEKLLLVLLLEALSDDEDNVGYGAAYDARGRRFGLRTGRVELLVVVAL